MRYVLLGNNRLAARVLAWLVERGDRPVGIVVHPRDHARHREELEHLAALPAEDVLEGPGLEAVGASWLGERRAELLVSVAFSFIVRPDALAAVRGAAINLHTSFLPYNRGSYPNVWSIVDGTPAGATLHWMDEGIDTGDIIAQRQVAVAPSDTGETLYQKQEDAAFAIFTETWPAILTGSAPRTPQPVAGTVHRASDVDTIDAIRPDDVIRAGALIDILRARTFPPYRGAYLDLGHRRVYLRLSLEEER